MSNVKEKLKEWFLPNENDRSIIETDNFKRSFDSKKNNETKFIQIPRENITYTKQPQIYTLKHYLEVQEVAKALICNQDVIVDITNLDNKQKYRAIDFLSGVIFVIDGYRKKLDFNIYLFSREKI
ncbi:MAG: cell division protein SepF [Bacilli bacterium]